MKKKFHSILAWIRSKVKTITPGHTAMKGAGIGLLVFTGFIYILFGIQLAVDIQDPWVLVLHIGLALLFILCAFLLAWIIKVLFLIPKPLKISLLLCLPLLFITMMGQELIVGLILLVSLLLGAAYYVLHFTGYRNLSMPKKTVTLIGLTLGMAGFIGGLYFFLIRGLEIEPFENAALQHAEQVNPLEGESPGIPGIYAVKTLSYGSGEDKRRGEYAEKVRFRTQPVNGVAFLDNWSGISGWWRTRYWGFDDKKLPLNAQVWYPEGEGPFPLALVVHGNHSMTDFSDPGYAYLGELLASRGIILASVDQNFINANWSDIFGGLEKENDARAWLLLEHLKVWHQWNETPGHQFQGKIDTANIALIGHSRGGEAVSHAALFNSLEHYPDDASIKLGYHFNIRALVAIAPVDGQYQPGETSTHIQDVNYLVLHGAQDSDVSSYMGSMQFERIGFSGSSFNFKSGLYVYGANHGQFNSNWGENDSGMPFKGIFNLGQLISEEEQQQIAKVYISAFLETTLRGKSEFLPLFADWRYGRKWLPQTVYLNQFEDSNTIYICNFDEDFDVSTGTMDQVKLSGKNLSVWREQEIKLKKYKKGSRAVFIGWHYGTEDEKDSLASPRDWVPDSLIASYSINMEPGLLKLDSSSVLVFSLAESKESSNPKASGKWIGKNNENMDEENHSESYQERGKAITLGNTMSEKKKDSPQSQIPLDFTLFLTDQNGQKISFPLSHNSPLQRQLAVKLHKTDFLLGKSESEKVFQKYIFPLDELNTINPDFDFGKLSEIRLQFDLATQGVISLDNVGFSKRFN
jgi:hypothetical protein